MAKLSIQDLASVLVEKNGLNSEEAIRFITTVFDVVQYGVGNDRIVKVKGLGTFKLVNVEARESVNVNTGERVLINSHAKISFTPDATMKEIVNKPFSSFETVVLNEGVVFDDIPTIDEPENDIENMVDDNRDYDEDVTESEVKEEPMVEFVEVEESTTQPNSLLDELSKEDVLESCEEVSCQNIQVESLESNIPLEDCEQNIQEENSEQVIQEENNEQIIQIEGVSEQSEQEEEQCGRRNWWKWVLVVFLSALFGFAIGYYFGRDIHSQVPVITDQQQENFIDSAETKPVVELVDSLLESNDSIDVDSISQETKDVITTESEKEEFDYKKYETMDSRVRTGAYYIIGVADTVKAREGDNSERLSRRYLGEGMACYIEVLNGINAKTQFEEGQKVMLPKLMLKKLMRKKE